MAEERDMARGIIIGGIGGTVLGGTVAAALLAREVKAAELPPDKKFDYLLETQTTIVQLLAKLVETSQTLIERNQAVIELLRQLLAAQGIVVEIPEIPGVPPARSESSPS